MYCLAQMNNIGAAMFLRKLDTSHKEQVHAILAKNTEDSRPRAISKSNGNKGKRQVSEQSAWRFATDALLEDAVLRSRCRSTLLATRNFDIAINQATVVLEDRIRRKVKPDKPLTGESLVGYAFNEEPAKTRLLVATGNPDDQRGITRILKGIVPAFRNVTHHHIVDTFSREDAMRICGFIDVLLRVVDGASLITPAIEPSHIKVAGPSS